MNITKSLFRLAAAALAVGLQIRAADVPISGLPAASAVASSNLTIVVDTSESNPALRTKKATVNQLVDGLPAASSGTKGTMSAADKIKLDASTASASPNTIVTRDGSGDTAIHSIALTSGTVANSPSNPTDITNKAYVDAVSTGLAVHTPAKAATTGSNVTLTGGAPSTVDGFALSTSDRVLVKDQTDPKENGIYTVSVLGSGANGTWARASDANSGSNLVSGSYVFINNGTTWASSAWVMTTPGAITIGTSPINWTLFNQVTNILASNIIGQIVNAQVQDAAISTTKFASGIAPISIVSSLPSPSGYTGPLTVFNTSDSKLYRYTGAAFVATTAAGDVTGQITTTQIADSGITTPKIAAGAITATQIAADTITAGQIAAGAVNTSELAANAVTAAKIAAGTITASQISSNTILAGNIAAGTITADRLNITSLSAISANIGTITAGSISGVSVTSTTGTIGGFSLASNQLSAIAGVATMVLSATGYVQLYSTAAASVTMSIDTSTGTTSSLQCAYNSANRALLLGQNAGGILTLYNSSASSTISLTGSTGKIVSTALQTDEITNSGGNGNYTTPLISHGDGNRISFEFTGSNTLNVKIDATVFTIDMTP